MAFLGLWEAAWSSEALLAGATVTRFPLKSSPLLFALTSHFLGTISRYLALSFRQCSPQRPESQSPGVYRFSKLLLKVKVRAAHTSSTSRSSHRRRSP